jgi:hypothetical protein
MVDVLLKREVPRIEECFHDDGTWVDLRHVLATVNLKVSQALNGLSRFAIDLGYLGG